MVSPYFNRKENIGSVCRVCFCILGSNFLSENKEDGFV